MRTVCWFLGKNISNFVPPTWRLDNPYYHSLQWGVDQRGLLLFARIWHGAVVAQFVCLTQSAVEHFYQKFHWTFAKCLIFLMREYCEEEMWVWVFPNHKCQKILSNHESKMSDLSVYVENYKFTDMKEKLVKLQYWWYFSCSHFVNWRKNSCSHFTKWQ